MTDAIFFDFYGTLVRFGDYHRQVTARFLDDLGIDRDPDAFFETWNRHFYDLKDHLVENDEFLPIWHIYGESMDRAFRDEGLDVSGAEIGRAVQLCVDTLPDHLEPSPGVEETLDALSDRTLAVVSNADDDDLHNQLRDAGLRGRFDLIVSSETAQAYKPHPRIFRIALDELDLDPADVAFVGDSLEWDIRGANGLGLVSVWYNAGAERRVDGIEPDHEIRDLRDVADLLG